MPVTIRSQGEPFPHDLSAMERRSGSPLTILRERGGVTRMTPFL